MIKIAYIILPLVFFCVFAYAQHWDDSLRNPKNSAYRIKNSPYHPDNSPHNPYSVKDSQNTPSRYRTVPRPEGGFIIYDQDGSRLGHITKSGALYNQSDYLGQVTPRPGGGLNIYDDKGSRLGYTATGTDIYSQNDTSGNFTSKPEETYDKINRWGYTTD